jgi:uncharacterized membrane protein (DUF485 family)
MQMGEHPRYNTIDDTESQYVLLFTDLPHFDTYISEILTSNFLVSGMGERFKLSLTLTLLLIFTKFVILMTYKKSLQPLQLIFYFSQAKPTAGIYLYFTCKKSTKNQISGMGERFKLSLTLTLLLIFTKFVILITYKKSLQPLQLIFYFSQAKQTAGIYLYFTCKKSTKNQIFFSYLK